MGTNKTTNKTTTKKGGTKKGGTTTPPVQFVVPVPTTPKVRTGNSTVTNPVGMVWVWCLNITHTNGGVLQPRKVYTTHCINNGVTYYTVRTQVNRYLQWVKGGCVGTLPRGVVVNTGTLLVPPTK